MSIEEFCAQLAQKIELPFEVEEVEEIEQNAGTTWIILKNGKVYSLTLTECEEE